MAQNSVLVGQIVQITADGLRANGKLLNQLFGADVSLFFNQFDNGVMSLCLFHEISLELCSFSRIQRISEGHRQPNGQPGDMCPVRDRHTKQIKPSGN